MGNETDVKPAEPGAAPPTPETPPGTPPATATPPTTTVESPVPEGLDSASIEELLSEEPADLDPSAVTEKKEEEKKPPQPQESKPVETKVSEGLPEPAVKETPAKAAEVPPAPEAPKPAVVVKPPEGQPVQPPQATPVAEPVSAEKLREDFQARRQVVIATLAKDRYALSEDQIGQLNSGNYEVISTLLATAHMDAVEATLSRVVANMPALVNGALDNREIFAKSEESFFQAWPQLSPKEHSADIKRMGLAYRQLNPTATAEEFIRDVGAQVIIARKIPIPQPSDNKGNGEGDPVAPPFKPATAGGGVGAPAAKVNPFEEMALEVEVLDLD